MDGPGRGFRCLERRDDHPHIKGVDGPWHIANIYLGKFHCDLKAGGCDFPQNVGEK